MKRAFSAAAVIGVALVVGLLLAEGALRLAGISYPDFFRDDPVLGRSLNPGAYGWYTQEGGSWVQINSDGLRDGEHALDKPADVLRIAVLGDSYAAAMEVPAEAAFWSEMERRLQSCPALDGRRVEVLNFGLGGSGTAQQYLLLQSRVWKYRPDLVLLAFLTGNDISDNVRALKGASRAAYYVHDADGRLVLDPEFLAKRERLRTGPLHDAWDAAFNHSRVLQLVMQVRRQVKLMLRDDVAAEQAPGQEAGLSSQIYLPPSDPVWRQAWRVTEDLVRAMAAEVRAHQAGFVVASLSNGVQVHPDPAFRQQHADALGAEDLLYPDRRIEAVATGEGVPFLMLVPGLRDWAEANRTCVHGFANADPCSGHWNEHGHRLAGERLAEFLCADVLPARDRPVAGAPSMTAGRIGN